MQYYGAMPSTMGLGHVGGAYRGRGGHAITRHIGTHWDSFYVVFAICPVNLLQTVTAPTKQQQGSSMERCAVL